MKAMSSYLNQGKIYQKAISTNAACNRLLNKHELNRGVFLSPYLAIGRPQQRL